jgi:enamine deaminase RidA (YjgF/YER057c/UK114 family)
MSIRRIDVGPRMSQAVVHGKTVYLAGQVAADPKADVIGQTRQILGQIDRLLKEAGTDKTHILSANVWLADIETFDDMNQAWEAWAPQGNTPARATTEARLARPEYLVEIACIAALPD